MCDPKLMANLSMIGEATGTAVSTIGAYQKSKGEKAAYDYQARVAENNAQMSEWQAQDTIARGQQAEQAHRLKVAQLKGTQRAAMAANGIDLTEGSALGILTDTDYMGELDALSIRDSAAREAWGKRVEGKNYTGNANLLKYRAAQENPGLSAASTLLTGAGSVAKSWYKNKKEGIY